jgi:polyphosphate kinase
LSTAAVKKKRLPPPDHFLNRELGLLAFNMRVLEEAENRKNPLLERLRFLCIVSSNLDEFFEVRFADMLDAARDPLSSVSGADVERVGRAAHTLIDEQYHVFNEQLMPLLQRIRSVA